jgi:hypothetical protein
MKKMKIDTVIDIDPNDIIEFDETNLDPEAYELLRCKTPIDPNEILPFGNKL